MSPADPRRRRTAARGSTLAAVLAIFLTVILSTPAGAAGAAGAAAGAAGAAAEVGALSVTMDRALTLLGETTRMVISGEALAELGAGATLAVRISGPATFAQLQQAVPALPEVGSFSVAADSLPDVARPVPTEIHLPLPLTGLPRTPGAYRVTVYAQSGYVLLATGNTWMGRVAPREDPLDLAFVWRAELGVHRDRAGVFFDRVLEQACSSADSGDLLALAGLAARFPQWRFGLALEPVLLTQLRDMADGYSRVDGVGAVAEVGPEDPAAQSAASVLAGLVEVGASDTVEVGVSPFAGPDLGLLAAQGWRDGFEQIQLGKQELIQTMRLGLPPAGAWSPGLDLSSSGLGDYGKASIDHVLVDAEVATSLAEPPGKGTVAVRARNDQSDRCTLVFSDSELRALMAAPWDPAVLFAGIAYVLASADRDALVLTQDPEFTLPPSAYVEAIGEELRKYPWVRTQTMSDLLESHPPDSRPLLLGSETTPPTGYIAETIFAAVKEAHALVDDLAAAAEPVSLPLEAARRSLFVAESRWWSRSGVSPEEASAGLGYAVDAGAIAQAELEKIDLPRVADGLILGRQGELRLVADNGTDYDVTAELRLSGEGLDFPQGEIVHVELAPGGNEIAVPVRGEGSREVGAALLAGDTVLGETVGRLRFVTLEDVLPWTILAIAVIGGIVLTLLYRRQRRRRRPS